jgi:hypothetical protein
MALTINITITIFIWNFSTASGSFALSWLNAFILSLHQFFGHTSRSLDIDRRRIGGWRTGSFHQDLYTYFMGMVGRSAHIYTRSGIAIYACGLGLVFVLSFCDTDSRFALPASWKINILILKKYDSCAVWSDAWIA